MNTEGIQSPQTYRERSNVEPLNNRSDKKHMSIPVNDQDLIREYESFQVFINQNSTILTQMSKEDVQRLDQIYKALHQEAILENNYKTEIQKLSKELGRINESKIPIGFKIKCMSSLGEAIKTNLKLIQELNTTTRHMIISLEKTNNYSTYINLIKQWKDSNKSSKNLSTSSTKVNSIAISHTDNKNSIMDENHKYSPSILSHRSVADEVPEQQRLLEEVKQDKAKLEDVVVNLKQNRNFLCMTLENLKDDIEEYEMFVQAKKNQLQSKSQQVESIKLKITEQSSKNAATGYIWSNYHTQESKTDRSMSRVNTTMFQDVSSKVSNLFGRVFQKKNAEQPTDRILSTEFMKELSLQATPKNDLNSIRSPAASQSFNNIRSPASFPVKKN